jgi:hypothetical protein
MVAGAVMLYDATQIVLPTDGIHSHSRGSHFINLPITASGPLRENMLLFDKNSLNCPKLVQT